MSETIHFDTHKFVKRMTKAGMAEETAEALADEQMQLIQGELATKQDLAKVQHEIEKLRADVSRDIEKLRADVSRDIETLRAEIAESKVDILKWMFAAMVAQTGVIVTLLKIPF